MHYVSDELFIQNLVIQFQIEPLYLQLKSCRLFFSLFLHQQKKMQIVLPQNFYFLFLKSYMGPMSHVHSVHHASVKLFIKNLFKNLPIQFLSENK